MSITAETAKEHAKDPAVLCCRAEAGTVLQASNLEDPNIFPDLEDSGLLAIPDNVLKIEQVLGATLTKTVDSLVPLTPDLVKGVQTTEDSDLAKAPAPVVENIAAEAVSGAAVNNVPMVTANGTVRIHITEGKGIDLEFPIGVGGIGTAAAVEPSVAVAPVSAGEEAQTPVDKVPVKEETVKVRELRHDHLKIETVVFGDETKIEGTTLTIRKNGICEEAADSQELVEKLELDIITPDRYGEYSNTIMDVQPIAAKMEGEIGEGVTRVLDGVIFMVTGTDHNGVQIGEFGSSEGEMDRNIMWGRPGSPDKGEIFIRTNVTIAAHSNMERPGPLAAHRASDYICEEIRKAIKKADESLVVEKEEIVQYRHPGKPKVVIVKEIMGQGAMHDNLILPAEPVGTLGAKPNVDLGNMPVMLNPLELVDGAIHALTCIGPASKEMSRHYWREPLVHEAMQDEEIDLVGVMLVGSPQANSDKFYVSSRVGQTVECLGVDGAIVTTEGFGNNHVDFASHIEQIGKRGVKVVGASYCAVQGALVVGNKYMGAMCDNNKSKQGIENEILGNNTLCREDAIRQLAMLKTLMGGGTIKAAERKWNPNVKQNNIEIIENTLGIKIDLVDNEQVLPKSKKRLEKYEPEDE
ncbi:D-proline reductase (dithiol) proprotein PrdA [Megasphaera butyrica]|mgnify:FL=1|uniref:D-proline reductase (dithiol) proprotein PrdA n=1 Tax=Megasphaera TaxID=906 RepID=UPI000821D586|nr:MULTISPECIES: D-proline reductase (dithiol) proprotein PrdA [Megasphaera]MCU6715358.1 D-proline reductase (dithiol) proprotein PrdA [Megasphaera butyrica]SCI05077.1 D-proline reductase proprotein prdA [uncultured Megasphaera sp.]SCJ54450.1 D-proline reductase proprotein prdA [uncultured Ruminococcus sp.]